MDNQTQNFVQESQAFTADSAEKQIREHAKRKKTLSQEERKIVAQNIFSILKRANEDGVSKSMLASQMHLGQGEAKEIHPYYLPPDKSERRLIAKAESYIKLLESLASIDGHSRTGSTSDLLREAFTGTQYWNRTANSEDVVADLYAVIKECQAWLLRDNEISNAYELLNRMSRPEQAKNAEKDISLTMYKMGFDYPISLGKQQPRPPRFCLGTHYYPIHNSNGEVINLSNGEAINFSIEKYRKKAYPKESIMFYATEYDLYLGPDESGNIAIQLVERSYPTLGLPSQAEDFNCRLGAIGVLEGMGGIYLHTGSRNDLEIPGDAFTKNNGLFDSFLDLDKKDSAVKRFRDLFPDLNQFFNSESIPFMFEIHDKQIMFEIHDKQTIYPLTMDQLDALGKKINQPDSLLLSFENNLKLDAGIQFRYGKGNLSKILSYFLFPSIQERDIDRMDLAYEHGIIDRDIPPGGWISTIDSVNEKDPNRLWSISDVLWIQARIFSMLINKGHKIESKNIDERMKVVFNKFRKLNTSKL